MTDFPFQSLPTTIISGFILFTSASNEYTYLTSIAAYNYFAQGGTSLLVTRVVTGSFTEAQTSGSLAGGNGSSGSGSQCPGGGAVARGNDGNPGGAGAEWGQLKYTIQLTLEV